MAEVLFDDSISSEEILDIRRSLQQIISFYQSQIVSLGTEDETALLVPIRSELSVMKGANSSFASTLNEYTDFTLDKVSKTQDVNKIKSFSEIKNTGYGLPLTPNVISETKKSADEFITSIDNGSRRQDRELENLNQVSQEKPLATTQAVTSERLGSSTISPTTSEPKTEYAGRFKNYVHTECFPCLNRRYTLNFDPGNDLKNLIQINLDLNKLLFDRLLRLLYNDEVLNDICNLLTFLHTHCIPDLAAMGAILGILFAKYKDILNITFSGASLTGIISGIFSPILSNLVSLLDKYLQLIVGPVDCVIESLDEFLARIDAQQGITNFNNTVSTTELAQERKLNVALNDRRTELMNKIVSIDREIAFLSKKDTKNNKSQIDKLTLEKDNLGMGQDGQIKSNSELSRLNRRIADSDQKISEAKGKINSQPSLLSEKRKELLDNRAAFGQGLAELQKQLYQGRTYINDKLKLALTEAQKLIGLNAENSLSVFETTQNMQRLTRSLSIVKFLIKYKETKGKDLCSENNDTTTGAIGSLLRSMNSRNVSLFQNDLDLSPVPQIVKGTFGNEPKLLIYPGGTNLQITDLDDRPRDISEVKNFNVSGVLPNVGNLADSKIAVIIPETQTVIQPTIIPLDFCIGSGNIKTGEAIQDWISDIKSSL